MACGEIYYTSTVTEDDGTWFYINGDTGYNLAKWTKEEAIKHYLSEEGYCERVQDQYEAWGFYD